MPPNLLFLYTDQQAFDTLAAYGKGQIEMPNLNRLAEQKNCLPISRSAIESPEGPTAVVG